MIFRRKKKDINIEEVLETELKVYKTRLFTARLVLLLWLIITIGTLGGIALFIGFFGKGEIPVPLQPYIAVININRVITTDYANRLMSRLDKLKREPDCKGVLVLFNTPGGSPVASDELAEYFKRYAKEKPLFGYVQSMAASGGYYIASAFKPLLANRNAVVGSIGVIMPYYSLEKLGQKIGVEWDGVAVGKYKALGITLKKLTADQKKYLKENLLLPTYDNFLKVVAKNRKIKIEKLKGYAEGKIYLASKVKGILVDKIISLVEVKKRLRKEFGKNIKFYQLKVYRKEGFPINVKVNTEIGKVETGEVFGKSGIGEKLR